MVHECHLGFDIVAAPIHFDGELVGFVFTGGAIREELGVTARDELVRKVREFAPFESTQIDSAVADGPQSVILPQVTFGIAVRMAVMSILAGS